LLKLDSYGLPAFDFQEDLTILDNYFPAYRDKIIEEIENDDYSTEVPKGTPTIDDVISSLHYDRYLETNQKLYKEFDDNNTVSMSGNLKKEEIENSLKRLQFLVEEKKSVETEVAQLRSKVDTAAKEVEESNTEETTEKKEDDQNDVLYNIGEQYGYTKEMLNPLFSQKKTKEEMEEITKQVRENYYKKKGQEVPKKNPQLFAF
jgi:hypothetical protein